MKVDMNLRGYFSSDEADDEDGLSPIEEDNEVWRTIDRKDCLVLIGY